VHVPIVMPRTVHGLRSIYYGAIVVLPIDIVEVGFKAARDVPCWDLMQLRFD